MKHGVTARVRDGDERVLEVDAMRPTSQALVIATHALIFFAPLATSLTVAEALTLTRVSRESFFFISAFVLTWSYAHRPVSWREFFRRRWRQVGVPYVVWTVIYFAYTAATPESGFPYYRWTRESVMSLGAARTFATLLLTGYYHLYYVVVLAQFYLLFPLLWRALQRWRHWHWPFAVAAFVAQLALDLGVRAGALPHFDTGKFQSRIVLSYPLYLVVGMIVALHYGEIRTWVANHTGVVLGSVALGIALALGGDHVGGSWWTTYLAPGGDAFAALAVPYNVAAITALFALGLRATRATTPAWVRTVAQRFGRDSVGIYLSQMIWIPLLVRGVARAHVAATVPWPVLVAGALTITYGAGTLFTELLRRGAFAPLLFGRRREALSG